MELLPLKIIHCDYLIRTVAIVHIHMLKFNYSFKSLNRTRKLCQSLVLGSFTAASLFFGTVIFTPKAHAQNTPVNATEIVNYAKAVLEMESPRQKAFEEIKQIVGNNEVPKVVCNDPNSFNALPGKAKKIAVDYCKLSNDIVVKNGFSDINRFNQITLELQNNESLQRQIQNQLRIILKKSGL